MIRVIIESPFGSPNPALVERNKRYLRACLRDSLLRGESPYASHGLYTQEGVLDDNVSEERDRGIKAGFAWRVMADVTAVYTDLGISKGMVYGIQHADDLIRMGVNHRIEYRQLGGEWLQGQE